MSRWWTEAVAALGDVLPLPLAALLVVLLAGVVALAWYHFPAWVPRRLPRLRLPRLRLPRWRLPRWRLPRWRRRRADGPVTVALPRPRSADDGLPADAARSLADRLAAEGRYAEAVRERLRAMVRRLVAVGAVAPRAGMTVTELTDAAARARPPVDPPLRAAGAIFAELWYAQRPAAADHDRRMRELADDLDRALATPPPDGGTP
ncbi:DUF4129 domain-containing protein [Micromonospora sp. HUAS LYJ1]|uniref:DUF4129 domain-containing protein n=1 Tax=Micromonospora sp. HUAS LYJ1 TaxID=3061626 RepID=UPI002672F3AE|nr:DUF4129 domain-containing protein [Micromonospora sp. HUAS LYJ1]WKU04301.1 DUF4129 domain-containing protein [Micromonospora sp. HUAS LYJ1]